MTLEESFQQLRTFKEETKKYLLKVKYVKMSEVELTQEELAKNMFKYLENTVEMIIKRKPIKIRFAGNGDPIWYSKVFKIISKWVELETEIDELMRKQLGVV